MSQLDYYESQTETRWVLPRLQPDLFGGGQSQVTVAGVGRTVPYPDASESTTAGNDSTQTVFAFRTDASSGSQYGSTEEWLIVMTVDDRRAAPERSPLEWPRSHGADPVRRSAEVLAIRTSVADPVRRSAEVLAVKTSLADWDGEGADPIPRAVWRRALALYGQVKDDLPKLPAPFFSPCADGTVFVSWTVSPTKEALIEVGERSMEWSTRETSGAFDTGSVEKIDDAIKLLRRLA